jgi:Fur family ferric uptake transcriptional regulator
MQAELLLRRASVRPTPVRLQVLGSLLRTGYPVSQPELARSRELKAYDRVTLYRTLNLLREAGLVHAVQGIDGAWRFCAHPLDVVGCPGDHPHFLCFSCGRMNCLTGQRLPHIELPPDMRVEGKQLVVYGRCSVCALREKPRASAGNATCR